MFKCFKSLKYYTIKTLGVLLGFLFSVIYYWEIFSKHFYKLANKRLLLRYLKDFRIAFFYFAVLGVDSPPCAC